MLEWSHIPLMPCRLASVSYLPGYSFCLLDLSMCYFTFLSCWISNRFFCVHVPVCVFSEYSLHLFLNYYFLAFLVHFSLNFTAILSNLYKHPTKFSWSHIYVFLFNSEKLWYLFFWPIYAIFFSFHLIHLLRSSVAF